MGMFFDVFIELFIPRFATGCYEFGAVRPSMCNTAFFLIGLLLFSGIV